MSYKTTPFVARGTPRGNVALPATESTRPYENVPHIRHQKRKRGAPGRPLALAVQISHRTPVRRVTTRLIHRRIDQGLRNVDGLPAVFDERSLL